MEGGSRGKGGGGERDKEGEGRKERMEERMRGWEGGGGKG